MANKIVVGPIQSGLTTNRTPFAIDNGSFPVMQNAYQWRGRIKRKRGTVELGRLERYFDSTSTSYNSGSTTFALTGGYGNILTGFNLQSTGNIIPGTVTINNTSNVQAYTDPGLDGILVGSSGGSGTINYNSGEAYISGGGGDSINAKFNYYPDLPVMGIEEFVKDATSFPGTIAFDTKYAYNILQTSPNNIYDVSFYKNPHTGAYTNYVQKTHPTPVKWNGEDYQQFWSVNYQGSMWATNGITIHFDPTKIGMQYKAITTVDNITTTAGNPPSTADLTITGHGLVIGDFVFINEVVTTTGINLQTGYVTAVVNANKVTVTFPNTVIATAGTGGIAQYLTSTAIANKDCLRWYDGDPTNGSATNPTLTTDLGWVNFCPPISQDNFSVSNLIAQKYYLVGARLIMPFKDRLLFIGPVVQTSAAGSQVYLQDTVIFSQNGTAYYTSSFKGNAALPITFNPILVPINQTGTPNSYWEDTTGFGGYVQAGIDQPITTVASNEDVLIMGLRSVQTKFVYTGNDVLPFNFFIINSELGSDSSLSTINMDAGVMSRGTRGFIITNQVKAERIDLSIPDNVFQTKYTDNGLERITAQRDFINEWVYFTYPANGIEYKFPNTTLQYNYRDDSWATFIESYTTYGSFYKITGYTWATISEEYPTWEEWNVPWSAGASTLLQPQVVGGNQQGFIILRDQGTSEATSLYVGNISFPATITNISQANPAVITANNTYVVGQSLLISDVPGMTKINGLTVIITAVTPTTITTNINSSAFTAYGVGTGLATPPPIYSPNHNLNSGDYIIISGAIGTCSYLVNNRIFSVQNPSTNEFELNPPIDGTGTFYGNAEITRMYVPFVQSKQFTTFWMDARKVRIGAQQYLLTKTPNSQIQLLIYLSQDANNAYNNGPIYPSLNSENDSIVYSSILYTCPESTNLGLTPANNNLQMVTGINQSQIWHRQNTSLIGDTVQVGFTMSDAQMRSFEVNPATTAITGASKANPCVLTCTGGYSADKLIKVVGIVGMTQLNGNIYSVISSDATTVTINVDSTNYSTYISGGYAATVAPANQFAEIEIHGFTLDTYPSMVLS